MTVDSLDDTDNEKALETSQFRTNVQKTISFDNSSFVIQINITRQIT